MTRNTCPAGRRPFPLVPGDGPWPRGGILAEPDPPQLALRMLDLLEAAQAHAITIAARASRSGLSGQMAALERAAACFELAPGQPLETHLSAGLDWRDRRVGTKSGSRNGDGLPAPTPCLALVVATDAGPRGAWFRRAPPLRCPDGMEGDFGPGGPYLVMLVCERDAMGRHVPRSGYAQPILGPDLFMPVKTGAEREVLRILLALQERLDTMGVEATVARRIGPGGLGPDLEFSLVSGAGNGTCLRLNCAETGPGMPEPADGCFRAGLREIADGSLVAWLTSQLQPVRGSP